MTTNNVKVEKSDEHNVAAELDNELAIVACIGQLHLIILLLTITLMFQEVLLRHQLIWQVNTDNMPELSALLKEVSLLLRYLGQLITNERRINFTSCMPYSIEAFCQ